MLSIRNQYCPNAACRFYRLERAGNVLMHAQKRQRLKCRGCGKTWAMNHGLPWQGLRSSPEKIQQAWVMMGQGLSIRKIAARVSANKNTIVQWKKRLRTYRYEDFFPPT